MPPPLPPDDRLTIAFAHAAYRMGERFAARSTGIGWFEVRTRPELEARIAEADVLVVSMLWDNALIARAPRLRFIQSISAGTDQYDRAAIGSAGIRLACAAGVNANAVAEHAMALLLAPRPADPGGTGQPGAPALARHDRRSGGARIRACRQDHGPGRPGADRRAAGAVGEGLRHAGDRDAARSGRGRRRGGCGARALGAAVLAGGWRISSC